MHDALFLRRPVHTRFEACLSSCVKGDGAPTAATRYAKGAVLVPQWGKVEKLDFTADRFDKRVIALALSEAGEVTELSWAAPARSEAVATALAIAGESVATFAHAARYAGKQAEIKALETEMKLHKARIDLKKVMDEYERTFATEADPAAEPGITGSP